MGWDACQETWCYVNSTALGSDPVRPWLLLSVIELPYTDHLTSLGFSFLIYKMNLFSGMIYKIFSHVFFQVASSFLWGTNLMNYIKLRTRVSPNHSFIHSTMFTVHFLWARAKIEWWVISDTGPSLMEFAVCCNSQDISQKPCCIIVSNTITIIKFIVTSHWEAVCPPGIMSYTISYCCPSFLSWQLPPTRLWAGQLCFAVGKYFRALI